MPIRATSTSPLSIWRSIIRSVWRTLFVIGCIDPPEHGAFELCDSGKVRVPHDHRSSVPSLWAVTARPMAS